MPKQLMGTHEQGELKGLPQKLRGIHRQNDLISQTDGQITGGYTNKQEVNFVNLFNLFSK
jgi:hypothetical protein